MRQKHMLQVQELAREAGITVRTLHHYDEIGLLKPARRGRNGYRYYGSAELLRLQQILFFRELDIPLHGIRDLLDASDFDPLEALETHRRAIEEHRARLGILLETIDKTILNMKERNMPVDEKDLYRGFKKEEVEAIRREVEEKKKSGEWDPDLVSQSQDRVGKMSKQQWSEVMQEANNINRELAGCMDLDPASEEVQELISRHHAWVENFYECGAEVYQGLAEMYVADERFKTHYDQVKPGLAAFLAEGMRIFAETRLI